MTGMPRVTMSCAEAVLCKAITGDPTEFAMEALHKFHKEQPELAGMIGSVVGMLLGGDEVLADEDPNVADFAEKELTLIYTIIGLLYGAVKAQVEANELEETFN